MCCRLFAVGELDKPVNRWCLHCKIGDKCLVYDSRPQVCREFECLWLQSQDYEDRDARWPVKARPDRCKVMLWMPTHGDSYMAMVDPGSPMAWREGDAEAFIALASYHKPVVVKANNGRHWVVFEGKGREAILSDQDPVTGVQTFIKWVSGPPPGMPEIEPNVVLKQEKKAP
jgi:hypothetical protein